MEPEIRIGRKSTFRGDDGQKVISIRIGDQLARQLEEIAAKTNRSRNEVINLLLKSAVSFVKVEDSSE